MTTEYLTMAEIEAKYPNEWVLIDRPRETRSKKDREGGYVVFHSPDRDEFDQLTTDLSGLSNRIACLYMGKPDPNEVWIL